MHYLDRKLLAQSGRQRADLQIYWYKLACFANRYSAGMSQWNQIESIEGGGHTPYSLVMKKVAAVLLVCAVIAVFTVADGYSLSIVRHRWQEIITESNHAALRPGSVYDILTHFEQDAGRTRPQFKYLFFDTGLGAADPIYPVFQVGYQQSWPQLIKAGFSD